MNGIYRKSTVVKTYSLIFIELLCTVASYLVALYLKYPGFIFEGSEDTYYNYALFLITMIVIYNIVTDWNRDFFERGFFKEFWAITKYNILITVAGALFLFLTKASYDYSRLVFIVYTVVNQMLTYLCHLGFKEFMLKHYKKSVNSDKLMVVTEYAQAKKIIDKILNTKHWNYELTYVAIMDRDMVGESIEGIPVIANKDNVIEVGTQHILDRVFLSLPRTEIDTIKGLIMEFEAMGILTHFNVEMEELNLEGKEAGSFAGFSVVSFSLQNMDYRRLMIKRVFDILGGLIGLVILIIFYPFVAIAIKLESKGPVIFKQERIGKNGRRFKMYKFRSMYSDAEERLKELMKDNEVEGLMFKMENDPRITKVGRFIRKTSIDELPQFVNILKGDMSLVGTRPPTINEFEQYNAHYRRRLAITPGLTGMWQVSGRSDIKDFDEVVKLDLEYIDQWSLLLDVKIIIQTVGVVLFRKGSR